MAENPGKEKVADLLQQVHAGELVIPYFQRDFEWQPGMVCDLLESILQDYYTGLILLWDLGSEEAADERWDPVWGGELRGAPEQAILDGQQRLSSLYYALYNPEEKFPNRKSFYRFYLHLNNVLNEEYEEAVSYRYAMTHRAWKDIWEEDEELARQGLLPLSVLSHETENGKSFLSSQEFGEWIDKYLAHNGGSVPAGTTALGVANRIRQILEYQFVVFPLSNNRSLADICNIFARVNAKGMKLSTFDLMNAFLYPKGIHLRKRLWEGLDNEVLKDIDPNMAEYLLKLMSLHKQNYCSSKYLFNLVPGEKTTRRDVDGKTYEEVLIKDADEFRDSWRTACDYAEKGRRRIMNAGAHDFGAIRAKWVPNSTLVPVLGAVLWERDGEDDEPGFDGTLTRWYWSAVFSEDYSGSSDTVMSRDFREWKAWLADSREIGRIERVNPQFVEEIDFGSVTKGSARYDAVLCVLALKQAPDFFTRRTVGVGDYAKGHINDHHIFPKSVQGLDPAKRARFRECRDSIANRTLLLDVTNNRIKNKRPSEYISDMVVRHGSECYVRDLLAKHLINEEAFSCLKADDFDGFLDAREVAIKAEVFDLLRPD